MELLALCETIKANAEAITDQIVNRWDEIGQVEYWLSLPPDLDHDHLPLLVRQLAGASLCTDYDRALCAQVVSTAAEHGAYRKSQGFDENLIYREYHLLRRALAEWMKKEHGESADVYFATMRLDAIASLGSSGALHGYHMAALKDEGKWPEVLQRLLDEWPLPNG